MTSAEFKDVDHSWRELLEAATPGTKPVLAAILTPPSGINVFVITADDPIPLEAWAGPLGSLIRAVTTAVSSETDRSIAEVEEELLTVHLPKALAVLRADGEIHE